MITGLPDCHFLVTYVAGPVPSEEDNAYIQNWLSSGGRWLALHGTSGGKADRTPGAVGMVKMGFHQTLGCRCLLCDVLSWILGPFRVYVEFRCWAAGPSDLSDFPQISLSFPSRFTHLVTGSSVTRRSVASP